MSRFCARLPLIVVDSGAGDLQKLLHRKQILILLEEINEEPRADTAFLQEASDVGLQFCSISNSIAPCVSCRFIKLSPKLNQLTTFESSSIPRLFTAIPIVGKAVRRARYRM